MNEIFIEWFFRTILDCINLFILMSMLFSWWWACRCQFLGVVCDSWEQYQAGECWGCEGDRCGVMGFPSRPLNPQPPSLSALSPDNSSPADFFLSRQNGGGGSESVGNTEFISRQNVNSTDPGETGEETNAKIRKSRRGEGKRRRGRGRGRGRGNRKRGRKTGEGNRIQEVVPLKVFFGTGPEQPYCGK